MNHVLVRIAAFGAAVLSGTTINAFAQRAPDPPPGQLIPFSQVQQRFERVVRDLASRYPSYLARACTAIPPTNPEGKNMEWVIGVANTLHAIDSRWGFNWKRGQAGNPSADVLVYHAGSGPDETTNQFDTDVYGVDLIGDCGGANNAQLIDITANGYLKWARWTLVDSAPAAPARRTKGDYEANGQTDYALYRRATGQWFVRSSSGNTSIEAVWGESTDIPVSGDFDGDGKSDLAVYRPSTGEWWVERSGLGGWTRTVWGISSDIAAPADYDGDGKTDIAVYRPSTGEWWIFHSSTGGWTRRVWGASTDIPVPGDYDGDGKVDVAVYRPSTGEWWVVNSSTGGWIRQVWGVSTDIPVVGDYDGDGKADIAVYRPSTGEWWVINSTTRSWTRNVYGSSVDVPVPGDYDGDGKTDVAVYRASSGSWGVVLSSTGAFIGQQWGGDPSDVPVLGRPR